MEEKPSSDKLGGFGGTLLANKNEADRKIIPALRNAAPDLLAALDFRPGDADHLNLIIELVERLTKGAMGWHEELAVLRRCADMAQLMEEENR